MQNSKVLPISSDFYNRLAQCSTILGSFFRYSPDSDEALVLFRGLPELSAEDWLLGDRRNVEKALQNMRKSLNYEANFGMADPSSVECLKKEYIRLFVAADHFEAPAYGSVYLDHEGVLFGDSTLELRAWMKRYDIQIQNEAKEPEDHLGTMLLLLAWLAENKPERVDECLADHLLPWVPHFLHLFSQATQTEFYRGLALLTEEFLGSVKATLNIEPKKLRLYR